MFDEMIAREASKMIKVVIADSEELTRLGICSILNNSEQIEVVAETCSGLQVMELARRHRPDVIVTEVAITGLDGIQATRALRREMPSAKVVVFTNRAEDDTVYRAFNAGAAAFLTKGIPPRELVNAVAQVACGHSVLSPTITRNVIDKFLQVDRDRVQLARQRISLLTSREHDGLARVAQGLGNAEIARVLRVSEGAVKAHVSHMLTKLGCANRVQAAIVAHDSGIFYSKTENRRPLSAVPNIEVAS